MKAPSGVFLLSV
ncbi:hypothetical protein MZH24_25050 [Escherichia coli]|nr:hypothetical protein [Escherichia coli]MCK3161558.1 hypothetical protein [Escherichia coli]UMW07204.1 hypothetical protein L6L68_11605 [Escherichia coli]